MTEDNQDVSVGITKNDKLKYIYGPIVTGVSTGLVLVLATAIINIVDYDRKSEIDRNLQIELTEKANENQLKLTEKTNENQVKLELKKNQIKNLDLLSEKITKFNAAASQYMENNAEFDSESTTYDEFLKQYDSRINFENEKVNLSVFLNPKNSNSEKIKEQTNVIFSTISEKRNGSDKNKVRTSLDEDLLRDYIEEEQKLIDQK